MVPAPVKAVLRQIVTFALYCRGLKLPRSFDLRDRLIVLNAGIEHDISALTSALLKPGMVVLDVGANIGLLTRHFCEAVGPSGKVFAFEPGPENFDCLKFNTKNFDNKSVLQTAISDANGTARLYLNARSSTGNSLLNQNNAAGSVEVECKTLDTFLSENGVAQVDFIKIDVEGAELKVLRGMRETLRRLPGVKVVIEYCPKNLLGSGVDPQAVFEELRSQGLVVGAIQEDGRIEKVGDFENLEQHLGTRGYANLLCSKVAQASSL